MAYKIYRRLMRKLARFILGFERCPADCRKNYRQILVNVISGLLLSLVAAVFFGFLVLYC